MSLDAYDAVSQIALEAKRLDLAVAQSANVLAQLLQGKLRSVSRNDTLRALKKELADYNIHTGRWK